MYERLQKAMSEAGVSAQRMAENLGLDGSTLSLKLRGHRTLGVAEAAEMAALLGYSLDDLFGLPSRDLPERLDGAVGVPHAS